jgi:Tfp pilus assembly protein PilZ
MRKQRRHKRFPFREHVLIDGSQHCESMDISEGGLYISAIQQFGENSVIDVTIPFKGDKLTVKAQVKYCQPGIGMGIELIDLNDEQKLKIKEIIENIEK